jgi:hypothetical protein
VISDTLPSPTFISTVSKSSHAFALKTVRIL